MNWTPATRNKKIKGAAGAPGIAQEVAALFKIMSECTHVGGYLLPGAPDSTDWFELRQISKQ